MGWSLLSASPPAVYVSAFLFTLLPSVIAQNPSTNAPVPPLQWINLTPLLSGSAPQGLKDASIGYDQSSQTLLIFGGEANSFPQDQTYLLNLTSLQWSQPTGPDGLTQSPPARSAAISAFDSAASNRQGHIVIGGKGANGALSDAWEFDYINHFWSQINISPGGPSARWGASGGFDATASPVTDPNGIPGPNNTIYVAGGTDGTQAFPLSDIWEFSVAGILSSNLNKNVTGSWSKQSLSTTTSLPSKVRQAGAVLPSARVVSYGGCDANNSALTTADFDLTSNSCAMDDAYSFEIGGSPVTPAPCPAPRVGPVLVSNPNPASSNFGMQAFMLLGTFNTSLWDDGDGLQRGEVDVLNAQSGTWARILPAGDPLKPGGKPTFPAPREGAAALSFKFAVVGSPQNLASDTVVFGGRDASGNYLSDMWILRAYNAVLTSTNATWDQFGDGQLTTGVSATGAGVTVQYITTCAKQIAQPPSSSSSSGTQTSNSPTQTGTAPSSSQLAGFFPYDTGVPHKLLSPLSVGTAMLAILLFRISLPGLASISSAAAATIAGKANTLADRQVGVLWLSAFVGLASYAIGIVGIVTSFTGIKAVPPPASSTSSIQSRSLSPSLFLKTGHGKAGLAFFIGLYGVVPLLAGIILITRRRSEHMMESLNKDGDDGSTPPNDDGREKPGFGRRATSPSQSSSLGHSAAASKLSSARPGQRARTSSWGSALLLPKYLGYQRKRRASDGGLDTVMQELSAPDPDGPRGFEVLNRHTARRQFSTGYGGYSNSDHGHLNTLPRTLSEVDWLERRRSVNAVGELDYALTQLSARRPPPTPATDAPSNAPLMSTPITATPIAYPELPPLLQCFLHMFLHALLLGMCGLALAALWLREPKYAFAIFLVWVVAFYLAVFFMAWHGRPQKSILSVMLYNLHTYQRQSIPVPTSTPPPSRPLSSVEPFFGPETRGPYIYHQPTQYRNNLSANGEEDLDSHLHHASAESDDEDEETQQRRIEQEMDRRDVNIVTVPKRKLWIANPS